MIIIIVVIINATYFFALVLFYLVLHFAQYYHNYYYYYHYYSLCIHTSHLFNSIQVFIQSFLIFCIIYMQLFLLLPLWMLCSVMTLSLWPGKSHSKVAKVIFYHYYLCCGSCFFVTVVRVACQNDWPARDAQDMGFLFYHWANQTPNTKHERNASLSHRHLSKACHF